METEPQVLCRHCRSTIPDGAKKCPHCHAWQSKWREPASPTAALLPAVAVFSLIALAFLALWLFEPRREPLPVFGNSLKVADVALLHPPQPNQVAILASVVNSSKEAWNEVHIQVVIRDSNGQMVDSWVDQDYDVVVPPDSAVPVRIRREVIRPAELYCSADLKILSARRFTAFGK